MNRRPIDHEQQQPRRPASPTSTPTAIQISDRNCVRAADLGRRRSTKNTATCDDAGDDEQQRVDREELVQELAAEPLDQPHHPVLPSRVVHASHADGREDRLEVEQADEPAVDVHAAGDERGLALVRASRPAPRAALGGTSTMSPIASTTSAVAHALVLARRSRAAPPCELAARAAAAAACTSVTETISPRMLMTPRMNGGTHGTGVTTYSL